MRLVPVALLVACAGGKAPPAPAPAPALPAPEPVAEAPRALELASLSLTSELDTIVAPLAATSATVGGQPLDVSLHLVARSGVDGFGDLVDRQGRRIDAECHEQDFNSLIEAHGRPFLVSHFECTPGAAYVTPMTQGEGGVLEPGQPRAVDWTDAGGLWFPCSGQASAWGTHLGSEEYEPDARRWDPATGTLEPDPYDAWDLMMRYWPDRKQASPYLYGWITEVRIDDAEGAATGAKHPALGRFSHEIGFVVGDDRTTYLSDDGRAVGWFMFVADTPGDLSAGQLYAAKLTQTASDGGFDVAWIPLGHATNAEIAALVEARVTFGDLFEVAEPGDAGTCPDGFVWTAHSYGTECLKLAAPSGKVPDPAKAASRLETRRYAAMLGATTELEKAEGVTWDPETGRVYLAVSVVGGRMLAEDGAPVDHVKMGPNPCGLVLAGETAAGASDTSGAAIDSPHVMTRFVPELVGRPLAQPDEQGNSCDVDGIANPDNLTFLPGWGLLMVAEDTKRHRNAVLWAHDVRSRRLARVVISPRGGELTGIHWIPDLGGHGYLTVAVQHPWGELPKGQEIPEFVTEDDKRSFTGWLGPFPSLR